MAYSQTYAANTLTPGKIQTFLTKASHDITLTETDSRVFIKNIKNGISLSQLKNSLESYGALQVYLYEPGTNDNGWALVGFEDKESAHKIVEHSENPISEVNVQESENVVNDYESKQYSNSFYAENEENQQNEDEEEYEASEAD